MKRSGDGRFGVQNAVSVGDRLRHVGDISHRGDQRCVAFEAERGHVGDALTVGHEPIAGANGRRARWVRRRPFAVGNGRAVAVPRNDACKQRLCPSVAARDGIIRTATVVIGGG